MRTAAAQLVYRRRASPLHAARATVAATYAAAIALSALLLENPILLGALLAAVLLAAAAAGVGRQILRAASVSALPLLAVTVIVNALASRNGITVIARLGDWGVLGQVNVTVEAIVYGSVFGLRLLVVTLACLLAVCAADPDELLFAVRRVSPGSALTAALATRLVPVLAQDARRLADAQRCRPEGGSLGARGRIAILRATVAGALDRSLDVAAVLEMRGYGARHGGTARGGRLGARRGGTAARGRGLEARHGGTAAWGRRLEARRLRRGHVSLRHGLGGHHPRSRHDYAFLAAGAALLALTAAGRSLGAASFHAYPLTTVAAGPGTFALAAAVLLVALAPFVDRKGIEP